MSERRIWAGALVVMAVLGLAAMVAAACLTHCGCFEHQEVTDE